MYNKRGLGKGLAGWCRLVQQNTSPHIPWNSKWNEECCQTKTLKYGIFMYYTNAGVEYLRENISRDNCFGMYYLYGVALQKSLIAVFPLRNANVM